MAVSNVLICNQALARIGNSTQINDLTEGSTEATACSLFIDTCRERLLQEFPWPFARKYGTLALVLENPNDDWLYSYRVPVDCIAVRRIIVAGGDGRALVEQSAFTLGYDAAGTLIFSDVAEAEIEYTARIENPSFYPPLFVSALAWLLATELVSPLARDSSWRDRAFQMYSIEVGRARSAAANESVSDALPDASTITVRN